MLAAASVLSTFDLLKKVDDENGREIEPKREYTKSAVIRQVFFFFLVLCFVPFLSVVYSQPFNFPCVIKPRSCEAEELIRFESSFG